MGVDHGLDLLEFLRREERIAHAVAQERDVDAEVVGNYLAGRLESELVGIETDARAHFFQHLRHFQRGGMFGAAVEHHGREGRHQRFPDRCVVIAGGHTQSHAYGAGPFHGQHLHGHAVFEDSGHRGRFV